MQLISRLLTATRRRNHHRHQTRRTIVDLAAITWVRDRGLDHAVEKEKNLKPVLNLKNLIKSEPSKSIPLSIIAQNKESLGIPFRPIDFIRTYPTVFEETLPGGIAIHPHIKLTPEVLDLDSDEQLIHQSDNYKQQAADRLLKLLMIAKTNKIPLPIIDLLQLDLGLPQDYTTTLVPDFPDYFQVTGGSDSSLELVCWSKELAVSVMEKKAMSAFPLHHSRGFEMDKKYKKWVDDWQKLPYLSPYENASHLQSTTDESDKWAVAVMHELLHLFVPKKTDRDNMLCIGEYLGLRSRFKRALLQHPGIFYLSSKVGTHTVVLKEAYKRDLLIETHPLMDMRYKYIHLMNMVREDNKSKNVQSGRQQKSTNDDVSGDEQDYGLSDSEVDDDDDCRENEDETHTIAHKNVPIIRGRQARMDNFGETRPIRADARRSRVENRSRTNGKNLPKDSKRAEIRGNQIEDDSDDDDYDDDEIEHSSHRVGHKDVGTTRGRTARANDFGERRPSRTMPWRSSGENPSRTNERYSKRADFRGPKIEDEGDHEDSTHTIGHQKVASFRGRTSRTNDFGETRPTRNGPRRSSGENPGRTSEKNLPKFSKRAEFRGNHNGDDRDDGYKVNEYSARTNAPRNVATNRGRPMPRGSVGDRSRTKEKKLPSAEFRGDKIVRRNSFGRSDATRTRGRSKPDRRASTQ